MDKDFLAVLSIFYQYAAKVENVPDLERKQIAAQLTQAYFTKKAGDAQAQAMYSIGPS